MNCWWCGCNWWLLRGFKEGIRDWDRFGLRSFLLFHHLSTSAIITSSIFSVTVLQPFHPTLASMLSVLHQTPPNMHALEPSILVCNWPASFTGTPHKGRSVPHLQSHHHHTPHLSSSQFVTKPASLVICKQTCWAYLSSSEIVDIWLLPHACCCVTRPWPNLLAKFWAK